MKRIVLFLITNLAVLVLLSVVARLLGLDAALARQGLDMGSLLLMAAVIGFAGSFISLAMSKWTAKHLMGVQVIASPAAATEAWLVDVIRTHAERSGVGMPEVGVFDASEMNAFATGARRDHALVALLANIVVMWFSRQREFRADAGGAKLAGTGNMIGALDRLDAQHGAALPGQMAAFGILSARGPLCLTADESPVSCLSIHVGVLLVCSLGATASTARVRSPVKR